MDAHPWTYAVSAAEVRREGLVVEGAAPGSKRIPDPRRFAYLEACGSVTDTRLAFESGPSGAGRRAVLARLGRGQAGLPRRAQRLLPRGGRRSRAEAAVSDVRALRLRAHTRPARRGEAPLPPGTGTARDRPRQPPVRPRRRRPARAERLQLERRAQPLTPDGPPLELPVPPR